MPAEALAAVLALAGAAWGLAADRLAARWPVHDDGSVRPVDWRTPVVVLAGAALLGLVPLRVEDPGTRLLFGAYLAALVLLLATDLDQHLLPDVVTLPAVPVALVALVAGLNPLVPPADLPLALAGAVGIPVLLAVLAIPFGSGAIGQGDLKLLVSVGLLAGAGRLFAGLLVAGVVAGVVVGVLLLARRVTLRTYVPFGPFLIAGAAWALLAAP